MNGNTVEKIGAAFPKAVTEAVNQSLQKSFVAVFLTFC